jgi:hypothetical protein
VRPKTKVECPSSSTMVSTAFPLAARNVCFGRRRRETFDIASPLVRLYEVRNGPCDLARRADRRAGADG